MPVYPVLGHFSMFPRPTASLVHPRAGLRDWALCGVEGDISEKKEEREKGGKKENEKKRVLCEKQLRFKAEHYIALSLQS